ncbi:MAG TPA: GWxTD domain-containing protein [Thermoanaerobaculia bacterium]|nr:GWxTD domain-containing protein [Thermoanaerobaculia bacterium]
MRRYVVSFLFLAAVSLSAATLPSLFYKAKEQFRMANYTESLKTLDLLQAEAEKPGNEAARSQLAPGLAFYRGACYAALGRADEARQSFETFLAYEPNPRLDPSLYPKKVVAAVDEARKDLEKAPKPAPASGAAPAPENPAETGTFAASYRAFKFDAPESDGADENWSYGPVRYLLTSEQRSDYERLSTLAERSEYIAEFWKAHDPTPETPENEFRHEFEKRVAYADQRLGQGETRGSLTDRGMLFVLLGPPTWVGRKPIAIGEDTADPQGMVRYTSLDAAGALKTATASNVAAILATMSGPANTLPESETSWREVWHYRRELLPRSVSYLQVDFMFVTKRGYGSEVLQRDEVALTTIEAAKSASRTPALAEKAKR